MIWFLIRSCDAVFETFPIEDVILIMGTMVAGRITFLGYRAVARMGEELPGTCWLEHIMGPDRIPLSPS